MLFRKASNLCATSDGGDSRVGLDPATFDKGNPSSLEAGYGQAGVTGIEFAVTLLKEQPFHIFTCQVSFLNRCRLRNFY